MDKYTATELAYQKGYSKAKDEDRIEIEKLNNYIKWLEDKITELINEKEH